MMIAAYGLSKYFPVRGAFRARTTLKAVDNANLKIQSNQIVGLVGESGSGKSTLGRCLIRLLEPTNGDILFDIPDDHFSAYERGWEELQAKEALLTEANGHGQDLEDEVAALRGKIKEIAGPYALVRKSGLELRRIRREMNIVFQDPYSSLNPRHKLVDIISEPMVSTGYATKAEARQRSMELLREVGLPEFFEDRYPHELSGGQRQRVAVARAISTKPKFLVLDEPTSALDVSVQAQILNMLRELRDKYGISMLLITHNIAVVAYLAEQVYVMYAGKIVEWGDKDKVLREPEHPYTKALMSAVPIAGETRVRTILRGDPPNLITPPLACRFHPRCPVAFEICGWSAEEVAEDLGDLLTAKYFATFGENLTLTPGKDRTLSIRGTTDAQGIKEIVDREKGEMHSLTGVKTVEPAGNQVVIRLHEPVDPGMYRIPDGREVKCLLYRPQASATPQPPAS
jgi:peptide/nickel transport system ATP-binding protein